MNPLDLIPDPEVRVLVADVLLLVSVAVPIARRLAAKTRTKVDDQVVNFIDSVLSKIPRLTVGK